MNWTQVRLAPIPCIQAHLRLVRKEMLAGVNLPTVAIEGSITPPAPTNSHGKRSATKAPSCYLVTYGRRDRTLSQ